MTNLERFMSNFHFIEKNDVDDEIEMIHNPNDGVIVKMGHEFVEQVALIEDRSLPKLVQKFVVLSFYGIEGAEWFQLDAFDDVEFEVYRRES